MYRLIYNDVHLLLSDSLNAKRKCDTIILNDETIQKKNKESDFFNNQSDNECFVGIESEEVEEIF